MGFYVPLGGTEPVAEGRGVWKPSSLALRGEFQPSGIRPKPASWALSRATILLGFTSASYPSYLPLEHALQTSNAHKSSEGQEAPGANRPGQVGSEHPQRARSQGA